MAKRLYKTDSTEIEVVASQEGNLAVKHRIVRSEAELSRQLLHLRLLQAFQHPGIVPLLAIESAVRSNSLCVKLTMKHLPCTVEDMLRNQKFDEKLAKTLVEQIAEVGKITERYNVFHGSIGPRTVFYHQSRFILGEFTPSQSTLAIDLLGLASLAIFSGHPSVSFSKISASPAEYFAFLPWSQRFKSLLGGMVEGRVSSFSNLLEELGMIGDYHESIASELAESPDSSEGENGEGFPGLDQLPEYHGATYLRQPAQAKPVCPALDLSRKALIGSATPASSYTAPHPGINLRLPASVEESKTSTLLSSSSSDKPVLMHRESGTQSPHLQFKLTENRPVPPVLKDEDDFDYNDPLNIAKIVAKASAHRKKENGEFDHRNVFPSNPSDSSGLSEQLAGAGFSQGGGLGQPTSYKDDDEYSYCR